MIRQRHISWLQPARQVFSGRRVSFDFSLQATDAETGERLQRSGVEHISYDDRGLIKKLEVMAL